MSKGFIFNSGKCVSCKACSAACQLENSWGVRARQLYTWNEDIIPGLPVYNYSLACNHCENPACMKACPAGCYSRDEVTGAILVDQERCLGCKYCAWNCPYKAPRFNNDKRVIEKCNFCYNSLKNGEIPACVNACPTGALKFGAFAGRKAPDWFPVQQMKPVITFGGGSHLKQKIIPANKFDSSPVKESSTRWKNSDASLAVFTYLMTILASVMAASLLKGTFPDRKMVILLPAAAAVASLCHLGKPLRAWRSLSNYSSSTLSREILLFITSSVFSITAAFLKIPAMLIFASISGLILLLFIDNIYNSLCKTSLYHSGQTFLTSLLLISYMASAMTPFTFIAAIKLIMSIILLIKKKDIFQAVRYVRTAILLLVTIGLISGINKPDLLMLWPLLIGELLDRFLYYADFEPENIKSLIKKNLINRINEEKRG